MACACLDGRCSPKKEPVEFSHCLSLLFLTLGMILVAIGYIVPRDYVFDPDLPASDMEAIEQYYSERAAALDVCIVVGTVFVGLGGLIIAGIFMMMLIQGDLNVCFDNDGANDKQRCLGDDKSGYGSVVNEDVMKESSRTTQTK